MSKTNNEQEILSWFPSPNFLDFSGFASNNKEAKEKGVSIEDLYQQKNGKSHLLKDEVSNVECQ